MVAVGRLRAVVSVMTVFALSRTAGAQSPPLPPGPPPPAAPAPAPAVPPPTPVPAVPAYAPAAPSTAPPPAVAPSTEPPASQPGTPSGEPPPVVFTGPPAQSGPPPQYPPPPVYYQPPQQAQQTQFGWCTDRGEPSPCVQPHDAYRHDGFYLRLSGGISYLAFSGSGPIGDASVHDAGASSLLAIGGTVAPGLVLAGALQFASIRNDFKGEEDPTTGRAYRDAKATVSFGTIGVLADWFPDPTKGWHVGGMIGLTGLSVVDAEIVDARGNAVSGTIFGGYDWWIGPQWSLGLMAVLSGTSSATMEDNDGHDLGYKFNALSAGLSYALTLH